MALLYHFWQYRAYFSVRYCLKQFVPEYAPSISLHEGLARSLNWYWAHPKHQIADEEYNRWLDALISEWSTYLYA